MLDNAVAAFVTLDKCRDSDAINSQNPVNLIIINSCFALRFCA